MALLFLNRQDREGREEKSFGFLGALSALRG